MKKILIVKDERDIRDLLTYILETAGYQVIRAGDGEVACRLSRSEMPDLVLSDVRLPKVSGYEVCRRLKADPALRHIPVLFLSAHGQEAEVQAGVAAGAAGYLVKPLVPAQLLGKVADVLAQAQLEAQEETL